MHWEESSPPFTLTAKFVADGRELYEYEPTVKDRHVQCWVPVATGQVISVNCDFDMAGVVHHVDFLVDGIIRDTWISRKNQHSANLIFEEGYFRQGRSLVSGTMKLSSTDGHNISSMSTPGSIEIRIYRADSLGSTHLHTSSDPDSCDNWVTFNNGFHISRVQPTHQVELHQVHSVTSYQKATFRAKLRQPRPGTVAWASLTYLYRSRESLQAAGLLYSPDDQTSGSPTRAATPSTPRLSIDYHNHKATSVENNTTDGNTRSPELTPKIENSGSTTLKVPNNFSVPENVHSPSIEVEVENVVNADSKAVVSTSERDISQHRNPSSSESLNRQPFTDATSEPSPGPLSTRPKHLQRSPSSPLSMTPYPEGRRSQQATDDSLWRTTAMHQDKPAPLEADQPQQNGEKRAHMDDDDAGSETISSPLENNPQVVLKRRKKDIDAKRVRVAAIQKRRDEAKCARMKAKKRAEEHWRVIQEQWESLDKLEQEMKLEILEDTLAAEAHLQECEESDENGA